MQLPRTTRLQKTRLLSSAIARKSMSLDSIKYEKESRRQDQPTITPSNVSSIAQDVSITSKNSLQKRKSIDLKSWKQQRQLLFQDLETGQNKQLEKHTFVENAEPDKSTPLSDIKDGGVQFRLNTAALESSDTEEVYVSQQGQNPSYDNGKSHVPLTHAASIDGKSDLWRNQESLVGDLDDAQTKNPQASGTAVSEVSIQTPPALPRKKDRWRNRITDLPGNHIVGGASPKVSPQDLKVLTDKKLRKSTADIPNWGVHKQAVKAKLGGQVWNPLKKLSPDARDGVKQLHSEDPVLWSTENLANHFQISPDAIRRILKSRWTPTDKEREQQQERWVRRGESIWNRYVELGYKAPRKWRGLNPMPAAKSLTAREKSEFKPEEWSQDQTVEHEQNSGLGPDLRNRIM